MDEGLRKRIADECDEWMREREHMRRSAPAGVDIDEWHASRIKPQRVISPPPPQPSVVNLNPEAQARWNKWADGRILKSLDAFLDEFIETYTKFIGKEVSAMVDDERKKMREHVAAELQKVREEISGLRIDTVVGRSVLRGEINELREAGAKKKART